MSRSDFFNKLVKIRQKFVQDEIKRSRTDINRQKNFKQILHKLIF